MPGMEQIGLESVLKDSAFQKAMTGYLSGTAKMGAASEKLASDTVKMSARSSQSIAELRSQFDNMWKALDRIDWKKHEIDMRNNAEAYKQVQAEMKTAVPGVNNMAVAMSSATSMAKGLTLGALTLATTLGNILANAIASVTKKIFEVASAGIMAAARVQELDYVLQVLGPRAGVTKDYIDQQVASIVEFGIRTDVAQDLVSQFIRYELDLAKAADLARVAQDTAIITMSDSSEELQRLLHGIQMYSTESLRAAGINIRSQEAFDAYAKELGKTTEALTTTERQQAILNAVLKEGARNAGLYEAAMESPGKQLRSFSRDMWELGRVISQMFLPAFGSIVTTMRNVAKEWKTALDEGGKLYDIMVLLGAVASIVSDAFSSFVGKANTGIIDFIADASSRFLTFIEDAYTWGVDFIAEFAVGIIDGASDALLVAINFVQSILTSWFEVKSPPKILPKIDSWGTETMTEWLRGFTMVDFSILDAIQSPLKQALGFLAETGKMDLSGISNTMKTITRLLSESVKTGSIGELLSIIRSSAGEWGNELAELAKREFNLATAVKAVEEAEKSLVKARERESAANVKTNKLISEYNDLLRKGASKEVLAAKLAEINASDKEAAAAKKAREEAEKDVETKREGIDVLQEQVALQRALVQELLDAAQTQLQAAKEIAAAQAAARTGGGGAGGGGGVETPEIPEVPSLSDAIETAIENMKQKILDKWNELWETLRTSISTKIQPSIDELILRWNTFKENIGLLWDNIKTNIIDPKLESIRESLRIFGTRIGNWWNEHGGSVMTVVSTIYSWLYMHITQGLERIKERFNIFKDTVTRIWTIIWEALKKILANLWQAIKNYISTQFENLGEMFDIWAGIFEGDWQKVWDSIKEIVTNNLQLIYDNVVLWVSNFGTAFTALYDIGKAAIQGLWNGIKARWNTLIADLTALVNKLPEPIKKALGMTSPSKVFMEIGRDMIRGLDLGIKSTANMPISTLKSVASRTATTAASVVNNNVNVNMGGVTLNNGMDEIAFEARLRQTLSKTFQGNY